MAGKNGWILSATKDRNCKGKAIVSDDSVQHCGVVIGVGGFAGHILLCRIEMKWDILENFRLFKM